MIEDKIRKNIIFSFYEKLGIILSQFISSILISRFLPREEFGAIAVVSGAFAFIQFVNIAIENVLIRDYKKLESSVDEAIVQFIQANCLKISILFFVSMSIGLAYYTHTGKVFFIYASVSLLAVLAMDVLISPLIIYASILFKQNVVTKISFIRWTLNVLGLCFLIKYPTIKVVMVKDLLVLLVVLLVWFYYSKKDLNLKLKPTKINWSFLRNNFLGYSVWVHLIGVISNIVYKADTFILYYFVSLKLVGDYNIALTVANIGNIISSILINQNSVALSHCTTDEESKKMTGRFLRFSIYVGTASFFGFVLLGKYYLRLITNSNVDEIYEYLLLIVSGLLVVKMLISPLVAYINIKGDVQRLFYRVQLPLLVIVLLSYTIFSYSLGAKGAAISNLVNGLLWLILIYIEINSYGFKISHIGSFKEDYNQVKHYAKKMLPNFR